MTSVLLSVVAVALVVAWLTVAILTSTAAMASVLGRQRFASPALASAFVLAPAMLALAAMIAILAADPFASCHCLAHGLHHPHLCLHHPATAASLVTPAASLLVAWALLAAPGMLRVVRETVRGERWARALAREPSHGFDGIPLRLVDAAGLGAFTIGVLRPMVVVDRTLWSRLSATERRAVVHHEAAHVARRDALTLAVLRFLGAATFGPWWRRWVDAWRVASELRCDRHAAAVIGDGSLVAQTLVAVERLRRGVAPMAAPGTLSVAAGADLERRVLALLDDDTGASARPERSSDLRAPALALAVLLGAALLWPGSSFHHVVETVLGMFIHH
ncbi:MAG: M56 family metallopeptidase [Polyangiaceae bacterium]